MFSQQHYIVIARIIRDCTDGHEMIPAHLLVDRLRLFFEADNPRFDYRKFEEACRVSKEFLEFNKDLKW